MVTSIGKELRRARKARNLSLRELAAIAEVSPSLLSQIENSKVNPSVATLYAIAAALSLPPSYFFDHHVTHGLRGPAAGAVPAAANGISSGAQAEPGANGHPRLAALPGNDMSPSPANGGPSAPIVRPESRARIELSGGVTWDRLTPSDETGVEFLKITYEAGALSGEKLSRHSGREYGLVLDGTLVIDLGFQTYTLSQGDSIAFDSSTPHRLANGGDRPAQAVWVVVHR